MQTIHKLDESDITSILAEKFDVEEKDVILTADEKITSKGVREEVISAKIIEE